MLRARCRRFALLAFSLAAAITGCAQAEVVAVVSTKNPVTVLSRVQAVDIFLGRASRYPDGSAAVPFDLVEGSAARDEFYLRFAGKSPAQVTAHWSRIVFTGRGEPPKEVANGAEMKRRVAASTTAIGYLEEDLVDGSVRVLVLR